MLSALIPSIHSYPAVHLVAKPVDQRYVQPSPLVLRPTPLKYKTPVTDRDRPVSRNSYFLVITDALDYTTISIRIEMTDVLWISIHPILLGLSLYGAMLNISKFLYFDISGKLPSVLSFRNQVRCVGLHRYESIYSFWRHRQKPPFLFNSEFVLKNKFDPRLGYLR